MNLFAAAKSFTKNFGEKFENLRGPTGRRNLTVSPLHFSSLEDGNPRFPY